MLPDVSATSYLSPAERIAGSTTVLSTISSTSRDPLFHLIAQQPLFADLDAEQLRLIRTLAMEVGYRRDEWIFREGDPANRFFVILHGYVSVEIESEGGNVPIRTLGPGNDLGWAWLFPPYYMHFSARTTGPVRAMFFYGTRVRALCEEDHQLGYHLMKRVAEELVQNLKAVERRLPHPLEKFA